MQTFLKTLVAAAAVIFAWNATRPEPPAAGPAAVAGADAAHSTKHMTPAPPRAADGDPYRGMAIQLHCHSALQDAYADYAPLVEQAADMGADTVLFVVHAWQEHAGSTDLHIDARRTIRTEHLDKLCELARSHGMRIILMPVILLENPRNTEWRGQIVPKDRDWDGWFRRYTQIIMHFAKIAERNDVSVFMVGSELIKAEAYTPKWKALIEEVRQNFRGKLGYSANWDHYQTDKIKFWPELDVVGMTTYYKLADHKQPTVAELNAEWARIKTPILRFQREVSKPIIFTEVGWCSQEGAAGEGWNYYHNQHATPGGHAEQAACYQSFLDIWAGEPEVRGIIWWELDQSNGGSNDFNYTPRNKPAEKILRKWFSEKPRSKSAAPASHVTGKSGIGADDASR